MVIVPVAADKVILESSLAFALKIQEWLTTGRTSVKQMYMLWNLVDAARRLTSMTSMRLCLRNTGQTMKTKIPDTKKYRREGSKTLTALCSALRLFRPTKRCSKAQGFRNCR